jgi:hypothetical protein
LPAVATSHSSGRSRTSKRRREAESSSTISTLAPVIAILRYLRFQFLTDCRAETASKENPKFEARNPKQTAAKKRQIVENFKNSKATSGCLEFRALFGHLKLFRISDFDIGIFFSGFLSATVALRLLADMRSYFLDKYVLIDGLGDIANTTSS